MRYASETEINLSRLNYPKQIEPSDRRRTLPVQLVANTISGYLYFFRFFVVPVDVHLLMEKTA